MSRLSAWIAAAVRIPNCVLQAFIGDLSDILGRQPCLLMSDLVGVVGMLVVGRENNM